uniref:Xylulose kinase-1 n=1 Tax=Tanacetum cinerariifolium TaxID=118510 RepID=A0A6L2LAL6_TANCI|nr:hypothetical protein [Tanacetum cinerariifolium]
MIAYLTKSDASEGFNQVIDFLNGSYIKYAITVNPNIYVSCIKQFWNTVAIKKVNDVTRLQALVDKKKVVVKEATIREVLRLDDAEGSVSAKCTSWNEFSSSMASAVICLSTGRKFNFSKYIFDSLVRNVDNTSKFYMYHRFIQLLIREQVGDLSTHTTKYTSPALTQKGEMQRSMQRSMLRIVQDVTNGDAAQGDDTTAYGEVPTVSQEPSIPSPTPPTPPPQPPQDLPSTSQGIIDELDKDDDVALMDDKEDEKKEEEAKEDEPAKVQEVVDVVTTAKLITKVVTAASIIVSAVEPQVPAATITIAPIRVAAASTRRRKGVVIRDLEEESTTSLVIPIDTKSKDKGKGIMVEEPKPLKKKQQVEMNEEYARKLHVELNKDIDWDAAIDHVKQKAKEDPTVQRYQVMKRKPQTEAQARKNMIMYLKNVDGFRLDYFKGMSYYDIRPIFKVKFNSNMDFLLKTKEQIEEEENRALQSINETSAQKVANRRKLNKEVEDLKRHLEIIHDEDDDVYTEATPLVRKVPVVDYEIINLNNKRSSLEESKEYTWSSKGQELEATRIIWCAHHNIFNHTSNFVSRKTIPTLKVYTRSNVKCKLSAAKQKLMMLDSAAEGRLMLLSQVNAANVILMLSRQS